MVFMNKKIKLLIMIFDSSKISYDNIDQRQEFIRRCFAKMGIKYK